MNGNPAPDNTNGSLRWKIALHAFLDGLLRPSMASCVGAVALAAFELVLLCLIVTPQFVAQANPGYLQYDEWDDFTYMTFQSQRIKHSQPSQLGVLFTGSSTIREAVYDDRIMEQELSDLLQNPVHFYMTGTSWQSLWETVAIVDHLPIDFRGVVVIGVAPGRLSHGREWLERLIEHPQLALDSPLFWEEVRLAGLVPARQSGIYLVDHAKFYASRHRLPWRLVTGPIGYHRHRYTNAPPWTDAHWAEASQQWDRWLDGFQTHGDQNFQLLSRLIDRLRGRGVDVALLETPLHPRIVRAGGARYENYCEAVGQFARQHHVAYWNLDNEAQLDATDFHDWVHLKKPEAQRRYQQVLAQRLVPMLQESKEHAS